MIFTIVMAIFAISQIYWAWAGHRFLVRRVPDARRRRWIAATAAIVYFGLMGYNFGLFGDRRTPVYLTKREIFFAAPFLWWFGSSFFGFLIALLVAIPKGIARLFSPAPESAGRRQFLSQAGNAVIAAPFFGGAYGLLYGRLNLQTTHQPIRLPYLSRAFDGFCIAQLSDIHIGPFMPADEIRRYVEIANALRPDLIVLTGDFVTWDAGTQYAVVDALSGLKAPLGIYGCLGNHDAWAGVEDSITRLFQHTGVHILRRERVEIRRGSDSLNLIGVDFQSRRRFGSIPGVPRILGDIEDLLLPKQATILLSHNPDTFDRAAELGIGLSLAGHTHGGQAALEFISPEIAPSRIVTPYVAGLFEKNGTQLYVNRGIGTIGVPIRIGAPPEITLYELRSA